MTHLEKANSCIKKRKYAEAVSLYKSALKEMSGPIYDIIQANLLYAENKLRQQNLTLDAADEISCSKEISENHVDNKLGHSLPRTILVAMVRNEYASIADWLSHILIMFDELHIVDHMSTDGTRELLRHLSRYDVRVHLYCCDEPGYFQSELMTHIIQKQIDYRIENWVFFLDADEFLPFQSKMNFINELRKYQDTPVISLPWMNLVPTEINNDRLCGRNYLRPPNVSSFNKIAYQPSLIPVDSYTVAQGNHALLFDGRVDRHFPAQTAFHIHHIPIRSGTQLYNKVEQGVRAYSDMKHLRKSDLGVHWNNIFCILKSESISLELLAGIAYKYGDELVAPYVVEISDLLSLGYEKFWLEMPKEASGKISKLIQEALNSVKSNKNCPENENETKLTFKNGIIISSKLSPATPLISSNHGNDADLNTLPVSPMEKVLDFFAGSMMPIDKLTPTAWGGHIPFMFCLMRILRPRTYVELGTHYGASYFAACQATKKFHINCHLYAIDLWLGDEHAGKYEENVYRDVSWLMDQHYKDIGTLIRKDFTEASKSFGPNSIDLLHIDGLHTYEAVKNDFDVWLPKMTKNGVILFHDTTELRDDFGVWKLWDEIKDRYVSFNFSHTHGLGVLALGSPATNPVADLLVEVNKSNVIRNQFNKFFSEIGSLSISEALAKIKIKELESGAFNG